MSDLGSMFIEETIRRFDEEYLPRLERAVATLSPDQVWWRPHEETTSIANLLIHLEGNVRQWFIGGLGEASQKRERSAEFAAREGADGPTLCAALRRTVEETYPILRTLDDAALAKTWTIQGFEVSGLAAVYHVLEHFGWHTGQITWIAKSLGGPEHGIAFYDDESLGLDEANDRERGAGDSS